MDIEFIDMEQLDHRLIPPTLCVPLEELELVPPTVGKEGEEWKVDLPSEGKEGELEEELPSEEEEEVLEVVPLAVGKEYQ